MNSESNSQTPTVRPEAAAPGPSRPARSSAHQSALMRPCKDVRPQITCRTVSFFMCPAVVLSFVKAFLLAPLKFKATVWRNYLGSFVIDKFPAVLPKEAQPPPPKKTFLFFILDLSIRTQFVCSHGGFVWRPPRLFVPFNLPGSPRRLLSSLPRHLDTDRFIMLFFWGGRMSRTVGQLCSLCCTRLHTTLHFFFLHFLFFSLEKNTLTRFPGSINKGQEEEVWEA